MIIDGIDYSRERHTVEWKEGDEARGAGYIEPRGLLLELQQYLESKKYQQIRIDRWVIVGSSGNIELRTSLGEVRMVLTYRSGWSEKFDLRKITDLPRAKRLILAHLREGKGKK